MNNKVILVELGEHALSMSESALGSDGMVLESIADQLCSVEEPTGLDLALVAMMGSIESRLMVAGLAKWAAFGFPQYTMGHRYAAALLVTSATEEALAQVRPPFEAFIIDVPNDLLFLVKPGTKELDPIQQIFVVRHENARVADGWSWSYTAYSSIGLSLYRYGVTASELLPPWLDETNTTGPFGPPATVSHEVTDYDKQTMALIGRLIINVCLAVSDPTKVKPIGAGHAQWQSRSSMKGARRAPFPSCRTFQVGTPVKHDFREHVRAFARGERSKLSVQSLISGHFKMQPHGPQRSLRKLIWLEPYWRGPEDAPIPLRPHLLGAQSAEVVK